MCYNKISCHLSKCIFSTTLPPNRVSVLKLRAKTFASRLRTRSLWTGLGWCRDPRPWSRNHKTAKDLGLLCGFNWPTNKNDNKTSIFVAVAHVHCVDRTICSQYQASWLWRPCRPMHLELSYVYRSPTLRLAASFVLPIDDYWIFLGTIWKTRTHQEMR